MRTEWPVFAPVTHLAERRAAAASPGTGVSTPTCLPRVVGPYVSVTMVVAKFNQALPGLRLLRHVH